MSIITELEKYLERAKAAIMTDMEQNYEIPLLANWIPEWEKATPDASQILETYRYISNLRDL